MLISLPIGIVETGNIPSLLSCSSSLSLSIYLSLRVRDRPRINRPPPTAAAVQCAAALGSQCKLYTYSAFFPSIMQSGERERESIWRILPGHHKPPPPSLPMISPLPARLGAVSNRSGMFFSKWTQKMKKLLGRRTISPFPSCTSFRDPCHCYPST